MRFAGATGVGYPNDAPFWVANVTFKALKDDGSATPIGVTLITLDDSAGDDLLSFTTVQNGTFTTKDEVAPVIDITTPATVSPTFDIAGAITEVGGMGTAQATLKNATHAAVVYDLSLDGSAPDYTFNHQVTWPIEDGVTLTVTATDVAGNTATTPPQVINVVDVGFSKPEPTGYIRAKPDQAQVFMSQMDKGTVGMILGSATYGPIPLGIIDTSTDYAKGTMPPALPDDEYWVNVSGTDKFGDERCLNWTFTLDQTAPVINTFTITDSDGDGYIEAGETLTLNWDTAPDSSFDHVALVDTVTREVLWQNTTATGTDRTNIADGNRDLEFRAYDLAGNYDSRAFHLYYDYMIWVNSTKVGEVSGIDTTYTAAKDLSRTAVSSITLYNGCTVPLPSLETLERTVTNLGQVTSDTYVTADNTANRTLVGSETYQTAWVYNPDKTFDFSVKVAHAPRAILVLGEANESYIADLINAGKGGINSIDYTELIQKTAYIFIEGGWAKVAVDDNGKITMPAQSGNAITTGSGSIAETLRHSKNQVNLDTGYRLSTQNLDAITLAPGDYALAAIAMDGDRIGLLGAMPVIVHESPDQGSISAASVQQNGTFTAGFTTPCEHLGVVLLRDVPYKGTTAIDAATLGRATLNLNITHNSIPATQKLIGNVYVSPNSGAYVVTNTNQATVQTAGLDAGTYRVYLVGQSARGTMQAYGVHTLEITPAVTPTPTPYYPSGGGGGGGGSYINPESPISYEGKGSLTTNSNGIMTRSVEISATDKVATLLVPSGVKALDANGKPLSEISISPISSDKMPAVPAGAVFWFAGYAYEVSPAGATFEPGITLTLDIPEDAWNALNLTDRQLTVKWYNKESGLWEEIETTVSPGTRTVKATITHFSTYALFTEPVTTVTPTETVTTTTTTTTPSAEPPAEGLPMMMILAIFAVLVIVIAAGYFFMMRK
ncbi:MAG: hypothetical protein LLF90_07405 [Methanomicrobiaceae archaeon]|uniref:hypothetical protein n=1 Tax=Methanoculleus sp. TaxID=90427 RepID=UPI0032108866|nr:hypothetical protein [Methanomicrobiaceae archaeon]